MCGLKSDFLKNNVIIYLLLIVQGCTTSSKWEVVHPDFDRLPPDRKVDYTADISHRKETPLFHFFHPDSLHPITTVGNNSTLADEFYDTPQKIDIDPLGNIYIVQNHSNSIRAYGKEGNFKYTIGRAGRGPGEFIAIGSFAFDETYKKLYVLDVFEVEIFVLNNHRFEHEGSFQHNFLRAFDLCLLNNEMYVSGYKITQEGMEVYENGSKRKGEALASPPITKIDLETFEHVLSFGFEYRSYSGWGNYDASLSETMLSCNEYSNTIVGYLKHYPYIFRLRYQWTSKMDIQNKWIFKYKI